MNEAAHRPRLTPRELQILTLAADGLTDAEMALRLDVAVQTVKFHVRRLYPKLGARNRAHAVAIGFHEGLLARDVTLL
jgi:DNA-binding NarL/FixJ family response regulator